MAPKKDVTSCEKLRGVANELRSVDIRMWKHSVGNTTLLFGEYIAKRGELRELKHLSTHRKRK